MKHRKLCLAALLIICICMLTGCYRKDQKRMEKLEKAAKNYYCEKYDVKADVVESDMNGSYSGAIGWMPNHDYTYRMSDGSVVTYLGGSDRMIDDRQYNVITQAFMNEVWIPAANKLKKDSSATDFVNDELTIGQYHSGDTTAMGYTALYEGDIRKYIKEENINLISYDGFLYTATDSTEALTTFCETITCDLAGDYTLDICNALPEYDAAAGSYARIDDDEVFSEVRAGGGYNGVKIKRAVYIEVLDGVEVTANDFGLEYEPGDITLVEVPVAELQARIDEIYESKSGRSIDGDGSDESGDGDESDGNDGDSNGDNGGNPTSTIERDILHGGKAYKAVVSERAKQANKAETFDCIFRITDKFDGKGFYFLPGGKQVPYSYLFRIGGEPVCTDTHSLNEEQYFYVGGEITEAE